MNKYILIKPYLTIDEDSVMIDRVFYKSPRSFLIPDISYM